GHARVRRQPPCQAHVPPLAGEPASDPRPDAAGPAGPGHQDVPPIPSHQAPERTLTGIVSPEETPSDAAQYQADPSGAPLPLASDVLVENFRPGTAARLGLGWDVLHERRPELVYASISGFGQGRPALAGYDQIAQGTSGLMSITGEAQGQPTRAGVPVGDMVA